MGFSLREVSIAPLRGAVHHSRSFYGVVHVMYETDQDTNAPAYRLRHGRIVHGQQFDDDNRLEPTTYYGRESGVGLAIDHHPRRDTGLRIGVIGLGVGTLAAYGNAGDVIRFYELNPGSRKKRYWVGFGAGKAAVGVAGELKDRSGRLLANFRQRRIATGGWGGGDSVKKMRSDSRSIGKDLANYLHAWAAGKRLD